MPTIEIFDGIKIECFSGDHLPPHVHISFGEYEVLLKIENGEIYKGNLPTKKLKKAVKYVLDNKEYLFAYFNEINPQLSRDEK